MSAVKNREITMQRKHKIIWDFFFFFFSKYNKRILSKINFYFSYHEYFKYFENSCKKFDIVLYFLFELVILHCLPKQLIYNAKKVHNINYFFFKRTQLVDFL